MKQEQYQKPSLINLNQIKIPNVCIHINKYLSFHHKCDGIAETCAQKCPRMNHLNDEHQFIEKNDLIKQIKVEKNRKLELISGYYREIDEVESRLRKKIGDVFAKAKGELEKLCFNKQQITLIQLIEVQKLHNLTCSNIYYLKNIPIDKRDIARKSKEIIDKLKKINIQSPPNNTQIQWKSKFQKILKVVQQNYIIAIDKQRSTNAKLFLELQNKVKQFQQQKKQLQKSISQLRKKHNNLKQQTKKNKIKQQKQKITQSLQKPSNILIKQNKIEVIKQFNEQKKSSEKSINANYNGFLQQIKLSEQIINQKIGHGLQKQNQNTKKNDDNLKQFSFIETKPINLKAAFEPKLYLKNQGLLPNPRIQIQQNSKLTAQENVKRGFKNYINTFSEIHQNLTGSKLTMTQQTKPNIQDRLLSMKDLQVNKIQDGINQISNAKIPQFINSKPDTDNEHKVNEKFQLQKIKLQKNLANKLSTIKKESIFRIKQNKQTQMQLEEFGLADRGNAVGYNFQVKERQEQLTPSIAQIKPAKTQDQAYYGKTFRRKCQILSQQQARKLNSNPSLS